jgi:glycosyltransferase involved in cell wall biosynthesis
LWIEKELFPFLPVWAELFTHRTGVPYVVDYDDAIFHNYDLHRSGFVRATLGKKIGKVMKRAALVLVGNSYLHRYAEQSGAKRVEHFPTVVDLSKYQIKRFESDSIFKIGWIGTPDTFKFLGVTVDAFTAIRAMGAAKLVLVGSGPVEFNSIPVDVRPWSEETEVAELQNFDVGIMPLVDGDWERGKCGYKLIQYMACGVPVIASPVGANRQIVQHGVNGFLASNREEWIEALTKLRDDPALRAKMGAAGRALVESEFSLQVAAPRLISLLREAAKTRR